MKSAPEAESTYDAKYEVARVDLRTRTVAEPVESLSMTLVPVRDASPARGELQIAWGTVSLAADWQVK